MGYYQGDDYYSDYTGPEIDNLLGKTVWQSNPNLLDNWYFVGGGSQQGGGQFPINQRGQTSYTGSGYGIDRWITTSSGLTLASDGISISSDVVLYQPISNVNALVGKQLSFSVLTANELITASFVFSIQTINYKVTDDFAIGYNASLGGFLIYARNSNAIKILSAKLELGSTQTLAHQENGVWVLNEVPNYQEQLARCQRYQWVYRATASLNNTIGYGVINSTSVAKFKIPLPVPMRASPTVTLSSTSGWYVSTSSNRAVSGFSVYNNPSDTSLLDVYAQGTFSEVGAAATLLAPPDIRIIFDANL